MVKQFTFTACHDKYGGESTTSSGFGLSPGVGGSIVEDSLHRRNNIDVHYNQHSGRRDNTNCTSNYNNYDRLGGLYEHMQGPCDEKEVTGSFLAGENINKTLSLESSNKGPLTFPNNTTDEVCKPQQMTIDKSPDVIPHGIGKFIISLSM